MELCGYNEVENLEQCMSKLMMEKFKNESDFRAYNDVV